MAPAGAGLLELWRSGCDLFVRSAWYDLFGGRIRAVVPRPDLGCGTAL